MIFFLAPPNLTKSQALYKFFDLGNLKGGGAVPQWEGFSQIRGGKRKKINLFEGYFSYLGRGSSVPKWVGFNEY